MQAVKKVLIIGNALVVAHVETAVMTEDAWTDIFFPSFHQLCDPFRIGKEVACKARPVDLPFRDGFCGDRWIHTSGTDNRDVYKLPDMLNIFQVAVFRHVDRRMRPVPCIIRTVVTVQHVIAGILQEFCGDLGFGHITSDFLVVFPGQCAHPEVLRFGYHTVTQRYREVIPACLFDLLYDLRRKAVPVLQRTAVFIGPFVYILQCELIEEISFMHGMDLHAVHPGLLKQNGCFCEGIDELLNLCDRHGTAWHLVTPAVRRFTGRSRDLIEIHERFGCGPQNRVGIQLLHHRGDGERTAETCRQLHKEFRAGRMKFRHPCGEVVIHLFVFIQPLSEHRIVHRLTARQYQSGIVGCDFENEIRTGLIEMISLHPSEEIGSAHRSKNDPVFDFAVSDFPGGKKRV